MRISFDPNLSTRPAEPFTAQRQLTLNAALAKEVPADLPPPAVGRARREMTLNERPNVNNGEGEIDATFASVLPCPEPTQRYFVSQHSTVYSIPKGGGLSRWGVDIGECDAMS